jgi:hypothetical protein
MTPFPIAKALGTFLIGALCAASVCPAAEPPPAPADGLLPIYSILAGKRFIDLTHAFGPKTPHWKGFGEMTVRTLYTIPKDGFHVEEFCHVGQWGTHVDPPSHFHTGLKSVDEIDPKDMLMPLVVLDVHDKVARNPDYTLTLEDVRAWEAHHGACRYSSSSMRSGTSRLPATRPPIRIRASRPLMTTIRSRGTYSERITIRLSSLPTSIKYPSTVHLSW